MVDSNTAWRIHQETIREIQKKSVPPEDGQLDDISLTHPGQWKANADHFREVATLLTKERSKYVNIMYDRTKSEAERLAAQAHPMARGSTEWYMLGLAMELLFKAIWFAQRPTIMTLAPNRWHGRSGHNLVKLAEDVSFSLVDREPQELEDLSEFIIWMARYPSGWVKGPTKGFRSVTWAVCSNVYDRAEMFYEAAIEKHQKARAPRGGVTRPG